MVKVLFDTNILIDYLSGVEAAKAEFNRFDNQAISLITWMEVMVGTTPETRTDTKRFLATFDMLTIDATVAERAVSLRQTKHIKVPDAIIWATAQVNDRLLVTRNSKDFVANEPGVFIPYQYP
jgi:predicted nucleic acid-binding protein